MCNISALKAIETLGIRHAKGSSEYRDAMRAELKKYTTMNVVSFHRFIYQAVIHVLDCEQTHWEGNCIQCFHAVGWVTGRASGP